ncbi:MAG: ABC transporter ATP-binding protein, partial [Clostridia bacterium]|nr:ABC transporter ATP-binding protein [Clostridia bacterium]
MNNQRGPQMGRPGGQGPGRGGGGPMNARINREKPKNMKRTIGRLFRYIGKSSAILVALLGIMICVTVIDLLGPFFQQKAIDTFKIVGDKTIVDFESLTVYLVIMAIIFVISSVLFYAQGLLSAKLSQSTVFIMRNDLFRKISKLPISYTDNHRHGDIMSRMTNDVENVSNAVSSSITMLFSSIMTLCGAFAMMIYYSWQITLIAILTIPITILVSTNLAKFMRKYFIRQQKLLGKLNGEVEEMVTSYKTVVAYGKEEKAVNNFASESEALRKNSISARVWGSVMGPVMNFLGNFQYVLIAASGGFMMLKGLGITIGAIQAMLQYSKKFTHPINQIANQYSAILTALAAAERIFEIMDSENEVDEGKTEFDAENMKGEIVFKDVDFSYVEGKPVLKNLNLKVEPGQKIAIVGATGSGKTTIVNLLTRFYEINSGTITVDGVDIKDIPKDVLR